MSRSSTDLPNRLLLFFFSLFVFSSTFSIALSQMSLGCALAAFVVVVIRSRYQPFVGSLKWFYLGIAGYFVWLMLAAILGKTPLRSIAMMREEWLFTVATIGIYVMRSDEYRHKVVTLFSVSVGMLSLYAIVQYFTLIDWLNLEGFGFVPIPCTAVTGNFSNVLTFANFFSVAGFFILGYAVSSDDPWDRKRFLLVFVASLSMLAALLTYSRGPFLYMMAGLLVIIALKGKGIRWYALGMFALLGVLTISMPALRNRYVDDLSRDVSGVNEGGRLFVWKNSLKVIEEHPVFGVGPGNFKEYYALQAGPELEDKFHHVHAHNDYLNVAALGGIPDALLFCGLWVVVFGYCWIGYRRADFSPADRQFCFAALMGSVLFFMSGLSEAAFADEEVRQMLMFVWGAGLAPWYKIAERSGIPVSA